MQEIDSMMILCADSKEMKLHVDSVCSVYSKDEFEN